MQREPPPPPGVSDVVGFVVEMQIIFLGIDMLGSDYQTKNEAKLKKKKNGVKILL
jgi:hypothetical protein